VRFRAPGRGEINPAVWDHPVFFEYAEWLGWCHDSAWPALEKLDEALAAGAEGDAALRCLPQFSGVPDDGLHYELRVSERGEIATRPQSWHDLFNVFVWLRHRRMKRAMNARQAAGVRQVGPRVRTRAQYALTHFDEAGVVVILADESRVSAWDAHDWPAVFQGLEGGGFSISVVGHALLEHALDPQRLLVGKAMVWLAGDPHAARHQVLSAVAEAIADGRVLQDPLELRPLPLMGFPGWHPQAGLADFLREAPCFQPIRFGRRYPAPGRLAAAEATRVSGPSEGPGDLAQEAPRHRIADANVNGRAPG